MTEYLKGKNINPISEQEFKTMLVTLSQMFNEDYKNKNSKLYKKAQMTFDLLQNSKCKVFEFKETLEVFMKTHTLNYWQPAHIYQIWKRYHGPIEMVM